MFRSFPVPALFRHAVRLSTSLPMRRVARPFCSMHDDFKPKIKMNPETVEEAKSVIDKVGLRYAV